MTKKYLEFHNDMTRSGENTNNTRLRIPMPMYDARSFRVVLSFSGIRVIDKTISENKILPFCCILVVLNNTLLEGPFVATAWTTPHTSVCTFEGAAGGGGRTRASERESGKECEGTKR